MINDKIRPITVTSAVLKMNHLCYASVTFKFSQMISPGCEALLVSKEIPPLDLPQNLAIFYLLLFSNASTFSVIKLDLNTTKALPVKCSEKFCFVILSSIRARSCLDLTSAGVRLFLSYLG